MLRGTCSKAGSNHLYGGQMLLPLPLTFLFSFIMKLLISLFLFYCQSAGFLRPLDGAPVRSHLKGSVMFIANNTAL